MRRLSTIKGLVIGSIFSAIIWSSAYFAVMYFIQDEIPNPPKETTTKVPAVHVKL